MTTFISELFRGKDWIKKLPKGKHNLLRYHWFNMVSPSPWPILLGTNTLPIILGFVGSLQGINSSFEMFILGIVSFLFIYILWNRDIIRESTFMGVHTKQVDANTILGFKLFLFSEIMLFVTFFWAHLYSALYPSVFIGLSWPPVGLTDLLLDPFDIPLTNTVILVYSGFTVTLSHLYLRRGSILLSALSMVVTILFGFAFLYIQYTEYTHAEFDISDGIYGSTFYMLTGFHGGHVIIGVTGLIVTLVRLIDLHFSSYSHTGYKLALIYWHFVDVVWIFVFLIVYVLGYDLTYPNIIYYTDSDLLGCVINLDQAFFGKWWRGVKLLRGEDYVYLNHLDSFERMCFYQIFYGDFMDFLTNNVTYYSIYNGDSSTFKIWFTTKKISEFTLSDKTQFFYDSLVNDQNLLSKDKSIELENAFKSVYLAYMIHADNYYMSPWWLEREVSAQWLYGYAKYEINLAKDALSFFYVLKLLPSFYTTDIVNNEDGLYNFYGKLVILNESNKKMDNLSMEKVMSADGYHFVFSVYRSFWPNVDDPNNEGIIPRYLRVIYRDMNKHYHYPKQIARVSDYK